VCMFYGKCPPVSSFLSFSFYFGGAWGWEVFSSFAPIFRSLYPSFPLQYYSFFYTRNCVRIISPSPYPLNLISSLTIHWNPRSCMNRQYLTCFFSSFSFILVVCTICDTRCLAEIFGRSLFLVYFSKCIILVGIGGGYSGSYGMAWNCSVWKISYLS